MSAVHLLTSHNETRVKEGLAVLAHALRKDVMPAVSDCKNAKHDIQKLEEALAALATPHTFMFKVGTVYVAVGRKGNRGRS